jgi:hypothetical protein
VNNLRKATGLAIAVFAILTITLGGVPAVALAAGGHGGGFHGGSHGGPAVHGHPGFQGHPGFRHPGFVHHGFRFGPAFPYPYFGYYPPVYGYGYGYAAPAYWYYCPSYGAYYPSVTTCPEAWVTVPSS